MLWHASNPQCRVTIYPQAATNLGTPTTVLLDTSDQDDLIAVSTSKDIRRPAGNFTVIMAPKRLRDGRNYEDVLRPGDLVLIEMGPDRKQPDSDYTQSQDPRASGLEAVMLGSIDEIRYSMQVNPGDGKPDETLVISGRDMAKYLIEDQVWWDAWTQPQRAIFGLSPEVDKWLRLKSDGGTPAGLVQLLLTWVRDHFDIHVAVETKPHTSKAFYRDYLRYALTTESPSVAFPIGLQAYEGAPWALMERVASAPLFVLAYDMRRQLDIDRLLLPTGTQKLDNHQTHAWNVTGKFDSQPALLLYRNPWSNRDHDDWLNLPTRVVQDCDVLSFDIGRGSDEISNTWRVWAEAQGLFRTQGGGGMADGELLKDFDSIQRYGNKPLIITTSFISGLGSINQKNIVKRYSRRLKDWNRWNEWYLNGRLTMKGMAQVKVGDRLWHWDHRFGTETPGGFKDGVDYYVEAVMQDFRAFQGWTTVVQLTRGQRHREKGQTLRYTDVPFTTADANDFDSANRLTLRALADQVKVWGRDT